MVITDADVGTEIAQNGILTHLVMVTSPSEYSPDYFCLVADDVVIFNQHMPTSAVSIGSALMQDVEISFKSLILKSIVKGSSYDLTISSLPSGVDPPILTSISPINTNTGSQKISARGSNFTATSVMVFDGIEQVTTFQDPTWIQATVTSPGVGFYDVLIRDAGGDSMSFQFQFK